MNELCFVWGAPLSGQLCWMARAAQETDPTTECRILSVENHSIEARTEDLLAQLDRELDRKFVPGQFEDRNIYCELPWTSLLDDLIIEEWIEKRREFRGRTPDWNLSFVGLMSEDAFRLPSSTRHLIEDFARATHSSIIVVRVEGKNGDVGWMGTEVLDFGKRLEIFEEILWPKPLDETSEPTHDLSVLELDALTVPAKGDSHFLNDLFTGIQRGHFGDIWAAEAFWKNHDGQFEAMTLTQGVRYSWVSDVPSLIESTITNGAMLNVIGGPLRKHELFSALKSPLFC